MLYKIKIIEIVTMWLEYISNKEIHRQQYRFVVHKFYVDGLRQFLNE